MVGLRERKVARTRQHLVDVALDLFLRNGYAETTMEQIAEQAEVGTTTLYRYFPSKDLLLLERLTATMDFAAFLRARPAEESPAAAIGAALFAAAAAIDDPEHRISEVRRLVDDAPGPRARLFDYYREARVDLEIALGARMSAPAESWTVRTSAGMMLELFQLADETRRREGYRRSTTDVLDELLRELPETIIVLPTREPARA